MARGICPTLAVVALWWWVAQHTDVNALTLEPATTIKLPQTNCVSNVGTNGGIFSRRQAFVSLIATAVTCHPRLGALAAETLLAPVQQQYDFRNRDRKNNAQAVIRDDYWYILGRTPPQLLTAPLKGDDPQWNAFGSCETSDSTGTNSCTYVSLNQRIPAYSKYASSIAYGAREYQQLGTILNKIATGTSADSSRLWQEAEMYLKQEERLPPPAPVDAELKMVLFATAMLTSPNFPGPSRELLVARYYSNEVRFANREILSSIRQRDANRALQAWIYGRDSWNSYFQTVARQIVPKVGDKFQPIA